MNADGSGQTLVQGPINDRTDSYRHSSWSPDGTQLVFAARFSDGRDRSELYVVDVDGSGLTGITVLLQGWWPSWSPDGTKIAFRTGLPWHLATMSPDGSNLTQFPGSADYPDWSPDGSQIIFMDQEAVFRINNDGTGRTKLTRTAGSRRSSRCIHPMASRSRSGALTVRGKPITFARGVRASQPGKTIDLPAPRHGGASTWPEHAHRVRSRRWGRGREPLLR